MHQLINTAIGLVTESYALATIGVIIELQHAQNGLPQGTILTSVESNLSWEVASRIIFSHAADVQKQFTNESTQFVHCLIRPVEKIPGAIAGVVEKESKGIFQYRVIPYGHNQKPVKGEKLAIRFPA